MFTRMKINKKIKLLIGLLIIVNTIGTPVLADTAITLTPAQPGAQVFLLPDKETFLDPDNLILDLMVDPEQKSFNAVQINFNFPSDILSLKKIDYASSSCPILAEEIIDNQTGQAEFVCGTTSRTLNFKTIIARVTFNKIQSGWTKIDLSGSKIAAADGYGTNILNSAEIHNLLIIK